MKKLLTLVLLGAVALVAAYFLTPPPVLYRLASAAELNLAGLEVKSAEVDGRRWEYVEGGTGEPLLLLHGFGADSGNWARLTRTLGNHYRIIAPDLLGFGNSDLPRDVSYDIASQAQRVWAFADAIGLERFDVGGNSMGGFIAGTMAAQQPDRVRSLWLLAPAGVLSAPNSELFQIVLEQQRNPLIVRELADFDVVWDMVFSNPPLMPARIRAGFAARVAQRVALHEQVFAALRNEPDGIEQLLAGSAIPTLITWGDQDRILHPGGGPLLVQAMAAATLIEQGGVGHVPMMEVPKQTADEYLGWRQAQGL